MEAARAGIARPSVLDARHDPRRYSDAHFQRDALNGGIVHVALQEVGGDVKASYVVTVNIFFRIRTLNLVAFLVGVGWVWETYSCEWKSFSNHQAWSAAAGSWLLTWSRWLKATMPRKAK